MVWDDRMGQVMAGLKCHIERMKDIQKRLNEHHGATKKKDIQHVYHHNMQQ